MSVVRATLVLLLAIAATARPVTHWAEEATPNPAASHWAPSRSSISLIRDEFGPGAVVGDKGALFGFDRRSNTECNTKTSHECYCATFTDNKVVGHSDKAEWFIFGVTSAPVRKIGVWAGHDFVTGVQVWFYDGTTHFYGQKTGIYGELYMFASERITKMSVWGNGFGRIGGIHVETSRGSVMKWGMTKLPWLETEEIHMDPGSGLMMNIFGLIRWSDNTLYAIGFDFLQPVVPGSALLTECVYPSLENIKVEPKKSLILRTKYENKADFSQKFLFAGDVEVVAKQDWGIAPYIEFENDYSIKSTAPMVHEVSKDEWAWITGDSMDQFVGTKEEDREYSLKIKVPPHKNYFAEAWLYSDHMAIDFVAVMELTLTTKATYKLQSYGTYNGTSYRKVVVDAYEYDSHAESL